MTPTKETTMEARARRMVEAYLAGLEQGGHPPMSPAEIAELYQVALSRIEQRQAKVA